MSQPDYTPQDHWEAWANKTAPQPHPHPDDTAPATDVALLRQALEALEEGDTVFYPKTKIAVAALRERLK